MAVTLQLKNKIGGSASFEAVLALVLLTLPLGFRAFTNIGLLLLVLNSLVFLKWAQWKKAFCSPIFLVPAAFFVWHLASLTYTQNLEQGFKGIETKLSFSLAPLFMVAASSKYRSTARLKFVKAFTAGVAIACFWALGNAAWLALQQGAWYYDLQDGFGPRYYFVYTHLAKPIMHPGYFSTYLGFGIFCLFWMWPKIKYKWPLALLLVLFFGMMLLLQGRINLIALFITVLLAAVALALKRKAFIWLTLPLVPALLLGLLLVFASADFKQRYFQLPDFSYDISGNQFNSATYRLAEWRCAVEVIKEQPVFGTGFGDHREALFKAYAKNEFWVGLEKKYNAHNQYLETTMALGAIGLLLLGALLVFYGRLAWSQNNYLVIVCLVFFAISMLTESMFARAWAVLLFNAFIPLFLVLEQKELQLNNPS
jgi:O-antigen ligase